MRRDAARAPGLDTSEGPLREAEDGALSTSGGGAPGGVAADEMKAHSLFFDGQVGLPDDAGQRRGVAGAGGGRGGVESGLGGVGRLERGDEAQEGAKMLRFVESADPGGDATQQLQVIELATPMTSSGAVEFYEWVPLARVAQVVDEALADEVRVRARVYGALAVAEVCVRVCIVPCYACPCGARAGPGQLLLEARGVSSCVYFPVHVDISDRYPFTCPHAHV
jgi:hypothetical protein